MNYFHAINTMLDKPILYYKHKYVWNTNNDIVNKLPKNWNIFLKHLNALPSSTLYDQFKPLTSTQLNHAEINLNNIVCKPKTSGRSRMP